MGKVDLESLEGIIPESNPAVASILGLESSDIESILKDQFGTSFSGNTGMDKLMDILIN